MRRRLHLPASTRATRSSNFSKFSTLEARRIRMPCFLVSKAITNLRRTVSPLFAMSKQFGHIRCHVGLHRSSQKRVLMTSLLPSRRIIHHFLILNLWCDLLSRIGFSTVNMMTCLTAATTGPLAASAIRSKNVCLHARQPRLPIRRSLIVRADKDSVGETQGVKIPDQKQEDSFT